MELKIDLPDELAGKLAALAAEEFRAPEGQAAWMLRNALLRTPKQTRKERLARNANLLRALQQLHLSAGKPSTRKIAAVALERDRASISHTSVSVVLAGTDPPTWRVLEIIVRALDGDVTAFRSLWKEANR